jgi:hypothetical protein
VFRPERRAFLLTCKDVVNPDPRPPRHATMSVRTKMAAGNSWGVIRSGLRDHKFLEAVLNDDGEWLFRPQGRRFVPTEGPVVNRRP